MEHDEYEYNIFAKKAREELNMLYKKCRKDKIKTIIWTCICCSAVFLLGSKFLKKDDEVVQKEDKSRYIVMSYDAKGMINNKLFCSEVRKNDSKKEVVCTVAETDEVYILNYPVSIKDVTYTTDYLDYVNKK